MKTSPDAPAEGCEGPVRMCVICRRRFAKAALTRHVRDAHGNLIIDRAADQSGQGLVPV